MKHLKVKDIVKYFDMSCYVIIWQYDVYKYPKAKDDPYEMIFEGSMMDIPWYILDYYLYNNKEGESMDVRKIEDKSYPVLIMSVVENKKYLKATK